MKIVGATGLGGLWALEWASQTCFGSIDRYWRDQYISVNIFYLAWKACVGVKVGVANFFLF